MRVRMLAPVVAVAALAATAPAGAHTVDDIDVIATGLDNPRHLAVSPDGDVYVAESGRGGDHATSRSCFDSAEGFSCTGATGAVTRVSRDGRHRGRHPDHAHHRHEGHHGYEEQDRRGPHKSRHGGDDGWRQQRVVTGLASFAPEGGGPAIGPHGIHVDGHDLLVTNGGPTAPLREGEVVLRDPTLVSEEPVSRLYGTVLKFRKHGRGTIVADPWRFEREHNPDEQLGNPLVDSNPVGVLADRGRLVVADAGGNTILRTDHRGRLRVLSLFPNVPMPHPFVPGATVPMNAVPTGVVRGPDRAYYVSQLTGFPFPVGGANVFRVNPRTGDYTTYATGFTNAMDLAFGRDGTLYVLEIDSDSLLGPGTEGGLWAVPRRGGTPERIELPAGTLTAPGGIAVGRDGDLYVTNHSTAAGDGEVLRIELDD